MLAPNWPQAMSAVDGLDPAHDTPVEALRQKTNHRGALSLVLSSTIAEDGEVKKALYADSGGIGRRLP